jgi:hypothetical protein
MISSRSTLDGILTHACPVKYQYVSPTLARTYQSSNLSFPLAEASLCATLPVYREQAVCDAKKKPSL